MKPQNLVVILSDEHNPFVMGCASHPDVKTPNIDRLAKNGTRFTNATCASPICVPTRAALATGRNTFEIGYWDNVDAYDGRTPSWHHVLRDAGHEVVSIGKLHYRGWDGDDYGFTQSIIPMHLHNGRGEVKMLLRNPPARRSDGSGLLSSARAGMSDYNEYDLSVTEEAVSWLTKKRDCPSAPEQKPWVLFVSLVAPHFPLTVPAEYFDHYACANLAMPKGYHFGVNPHAHPFEQEYSKDCSYNLHFRTREDVHRALAGYYGLVSFLDDNVGRIVSTLDECNLSETTRVVYLSDHGDNAGARGLWGKSTMYAESVGIPLILSGLDVPKGKIESSAVSQIDIYRTVLDAVGCPDTRETSPRSLSLLGSIPTDRVTLSEYHTVGSRSAVFMIQDRSMKYVHYCDLPSQLFDLEVDPQELVDVSTFPEYQPQVQKWRETLHEFCDPQEVDAAAKRRQRELIQFYGGEEQIRAGQGIGGYTPPPKVA